MQSSPQQYIVDEKGNKISVILPFSEYQQMQEDLHDLAVIAERKNENTHTLHEMKKRLGSNL
ncbi:type II toxin-antitoxin system Phd/YefM family antitoxin [Methanogenium sp. MK-MG]|uniref:type II toxin-antitoxin system Phd/YefM family antitoxin n=1 Tax=Methanogenium sp. MK-MG TaxID=2599926 RepID=UPI0013ED490C|nr:type II toxin-antitoxin system Phd/YefM family antitoxin [Methanogenium sp. MK-MG]KAF1073555.1 hypothetical protein MKMG_02135 [Methanogenium sp. MK-MG]